MPAQGIAARRPTSAASSSRNTNTSPEAARARSIRTRKPCVCARETVEHPFATLKMRMGATHFLMKTLPKVATEMALHVLAYNLTRVMNIFGIKPFLAAIRAGERVMLCRPRDRSGRSAWLKVVPGLTPRLDTAKIGSEESRLEV